LKFFLIKSTGIFGAQFNTKTMKEIKVQHPETFEYYFDNFMGLFIVFLNISLLVIIIYYIIRLYRKIIKYLDKKNDI
jgi:hypothetical protein